MQIEPKSSKLKLLVKLVEHGMHCITQFVFLVHL